MKKLLIAGILLLSGTAHAAFLEYTIKDTVTLVFPGKTFSGVVLYDFVGKETLAGGETDIIRFPKVPDLSLTVGAVGDFSSRSESELNQDDREFLKGTPFFGAKYNVEKLEIKDVVHFGVFYGRNLDEGRNLFGVKSSVKFW